MRDRKETKRVLFEPLGRNRNREDGKFWNARVRKRRTRFGEVLGAQIRVVEEDGQQVKVKEGTGQIGRVRPIYYASGARRVGPIGDQL